MSAPKTNREWEELVGHIDPDDRDAMRAATASATVRQLFECILPLLYARRPALRTRVRQETRDGSIRWVISGQGGGVFTMAFRGGELQVESHEGTPATATLRLNAEDFEALRNGWLQPQQAIQTRRLGIEGDLGFLLNHPCVIPV